MAPSRPHPESASEAPSLLVLATPDWTGDYMKSTVALTRELAASYRVLYVEHPPTYTSIAREALAGPLADGVRALGRRRARVRRVDTAKGRNPIHVLTPPPVWPMNRLPAALYDRVLARNARQIRRAVQPRLEALSMTSPVVLNALNPHYGLALAGAFDEQSRVYYCFDELRARDWNGRHGGRLEDRYLQHVDAVISSSPGLHERLSGQHDTAYLVPNGVNFSLFNRAVDPAPSPAGQVPCIGYVGSLGDRIDVDLVTRLIETHPEWRYRFVGRVTAPSVRRLDRYEHVTLTGPKPPETLPDEMRRMDVGLIPFVRNDFTRSIYPLKVNEYLAAALPVVTTAFADLSDLQGVLSIARTDSQFIEAVEAAVREGGDEERRQQRIEVAAANRWRHRARDVRTVLNRTQAAAPPA
jgi:glycosyltransferase involved in cell wall biosynthesis